MDIGLTEVPPIRKPTKDSPGKESAVLLHRQQLKTKMKYNKVEDPKAPHAKQVGDENLKKSINCFDLLSDLFEHLCAELLIWKCRDKFIFVNSVCVCVCVSVDFKCTVTCPNGLFFSGSVHTLFIFRSQYPK